MVLRATYDVCNDAITHNALRRAKLEENKHYKFKVIEEWNDKKMSKKDVAGL